MRKYKTEEKNLHTLIKFDFQSRDTTEDDDQLQVINRKMNEFVFSIQ